MRARRTAFGGAAIAAVVGAWTAGRNRSERRDDDRVPGSISDATAISTTGRTGRATRLWALIARNAARNAVLRARMVTADEGRRTSLRDQYMISTSDDVAARLGEMRGVLMKVGQMMSVIVEALPEPTRDALATLQESAPPMEPALAAKVVTEDLGTEPERLFAEWQPEPVAAASIGQVHRAVTRSGEQVAVKVQYPGVRTAIESDLANGALLYHLVGKWFDSLNAAALVDEFRDRVTEELDYRLEAANQKEFAEIFASHPWVRIPRSLPDYSSGRVLTSEWIEGARFAEFAADASAEVRQRSAEVVWRFAQHSIHRHLMFNGDPHPGNFRFHHDGTVSFLDFGMVKRWDPHEWAELRHTLDAVVLDGDPETICDAMRISGFLATDRTVDPIATARLVCAPFEPYFVDHFEFSPEWLRDALGRSTALRAENTEVMQALNIPPSFLILNRVVWGINALMSKLGAAGPFRAMLLEYVADGEPATPIGAAEAEWRTRHFDRGR